MAVQFKYLALPPKGLRDSELWPYYFYREYRHVGSSLRSRLDPETLYAGSDLVEELGKHFKGKEKIRINILVHSDMITYYSRSEMLALCKTIINAAKKQVLVIVVPEKETKE